MRIDKSISDRLKGLSFLFVCFVVSIHCSLVEYGRWFGSDGQKELDELPAFLSFLFSDTLARIAVPFFFVISGLLSGKDGGGCYLHLLARRVRTLLLPYVLWNLIYWIFKCLTGKYAFTLDWNSLRLILGFSLDGGLACGQFWYVRCLLVYFLVLPIIRIILSNAFTGGFILVLGLVAWFFGVRGYGCHTLGLPNLLAFSAGVYFAFHFDAFKAVTGRFLRIIDPFILWMLFVAIALQVGAAMFHRQEYYYFERIVILVGLVAVWGKAGSLFCKIVKFAEPLWGVSFFIYAVHIIFVSIIIKLTPAGVNLCLAYVLRVVGAITFSLSLGVAMRRFVPRLFAVLTGGRG